MGCLDTEQREQTPRSKGTPLLNALHRLSSTWDGLRHFHKNPVFIAAWVRWLAPGLRFLTPAKRRLLLGLAATFVLIKRPVRAHAEATQWLGAGNPMLGKVLIVMLLLAFVCFAYWVAKHFASMPNFLKRHPQLCLHAVFWSLVIYLWTGLGGNSTARIAIAGCAILFPFLLWRLGYMFFTAQRGKMAGTKFTDHLFYIWPIYGGSETPYGKGHDYLTANEAKDVESLAKSQLAGLKLFALGALCSVARGVLRAVGFGEDNAYLHALGGFTLNLPEVSELIRNPGAYPPWQGWPSIYFDLFQLVLGLGSKGHIIIGWLRLFGFNVFRNTYKPLLAETIVEFWNRYYYYFKEVLVNFFFLPTFARYFKKSPGVRMFAAVFMAAFVGNLYYHLTLRSEFIEGNFVGLWQAMNSRILYCFLLALGIYISMKREQARPRGLARTLPCRAVAIFGVWTFFGIIHLWARGGIGSFGDRCRAFFALFGFV